MAMNKQITLEQAVEKVHDGMTIMFGGFLGVGTQCKSSTKSLKKA